MIVIQNWEINASVNQPAKESLNNAIDNSQVQQIDTISIMRNQIQRQQIQHEATQAQDMHVSDYNPSKANLTQYIEASQKIQIDILPNRDNQFQGQQESSQGESQDLRGNKVHQNQKASLNEHVYLLQDRVTKAEKRHNQSSPAKAGSKTYSSSTESHHDKAV